MKQAFTLIELLIVIAIIGVIATLAVVQLVSSREKARIARGSAFSGQILRRLGNDLIGRWDFDECNGTTAIDSSGLGNIGTLMGGATWSTQTPSKQGCALSFNGTDAYVDVGHTPSLNIPTGESVTMCAWTYFTGTADVYYGVMAKRDDGMAPGYAYGINFLLNDFQVYADGPSGVQRFPYTLPTNTWTHVCGVISEKPTALYIDGSLHGTLGSGGGVISNASHFKIGRSSDTGTTEYFSGLIDDVRVFSRSLTAQDIQQLYAEASSRHVATR